MRNWQETAAAGEALPREGDDEPKKKSKKIARKLKSKMRRQKLKHCWMPKRAATATVDARAEVRAPAGTAGYTQRARRPAI